MLLPVIYLILGLVLLIKGADFLVSGAASIARRLHVSDLVIGLTVVAFGTSSPELFVNLLASFRGTTDIAIGNIIGSNIANILLILGVCALIHPLTVTKGTVWKGIPFSLLAVIFAPLLHGLGLAILTGLPFLKGLWTGLYNAPLAPFTRFNETVAMGGFVLALLLIAPNYFGFRFLVQQYREKWLAKMETWKIVKVIKSSKPLQLYLKLRTMGR